MSTANTIYDQLRAAIIDGTFSSGDPIRQDQIARNFGVSKIPVREALVQLEADGFVEMFSGRGAFVTQPSSAEAEEIYLIRNALEPILLERAIPTAGMSHWLRTGGILDALSINELSFHQWHALDSEFHSALYHNANLPLMKTHVANLHSNLARYYRIYETFGEGFRAVGETEHHTILEACKTKDTKAAVSALKQHLSRASKQLVEALKASEEGK
ncbi:MAG TPA: GntR family transcriptional regulator [Anaerolineales bacterium]|nr:GntR family transcriptional regulator [Anaerolineales bacterium]